MFMTFTPRKGWIDKPENRKALAARISCIVWGKPSRIEDEIPYEKKGQGTEGQFMDFTLDSNNDWWLHVKPDGWCELQYRYKWSDEQWAALKTVIEMFVSKPKDD